LAFSHVRYDSGIASILIDDVGRVIVVGSGERKRN